VHERQDAGGQPVRAGVCLQPSENRERPAEQPCSETCLLSQVVRRQVQLPPARDPVLERVPLPFCGQHAPAHRRPATRGGELCFRASLSSI